jgi:uncharacterized membrane protein
MELLYVLIAVILIATPVLAILAFAGVRRIQNSLGNLPLQSLVNRMNVLEQRLAAMEKKYSALTGEQFHGDAAHLQPPRAETPRPAVPVQPTPPVPPTHVTHTPAPVETAKARQPAAPIDRIRSLAESARSAAPRKASAPMDMEALIGGNWLNRIGIVAIIAAVSFFLKYAFDNNWIGPRGRVGIGILLGALMLPWSQWLLSRGYQYFSEGIAALGAAVLYLSIWAGWHYYALFNQSVAFAAMIVVTVVMAIVALGRNSQRIAVLSLLGGFLTPAIISTGKDQQVVLFTYLLILGAGLLVMAARRDWRWLAPLAFVLSQLYFWDWYETFYRVERLERTVAFATLFFLLYAAMPLLRAIRLSRIDQLDVLVVLVNAFAYLSALYAMLWPAYRWPMTVLVLALSAAHVIAARLIPPAKPDESPLARYLFAGLALTFATLAIPIRLDGKWITLAFAVEGAILVWTGFRSVTLLARQAGYLLLGIAAFRVLALPLPAQTFLFNQRFATYLALIACLGAALVAAQRYLDSIGAGEKNFLAVVAIAGNVYALIAFSLELWDYFGRAASLQMDRGLAQHLALTLFWTAYATVLILVGVKRSSALLRWQALGLFLVVVMKVFLYDSSYLERFYRILSFLILGVVLLVVSFLYQRRASRERAAS